MANPHGTPIWYELLTPDQAASKRFYDAVAGWEIGPQLNREPDYRMIQAGSANVGGAMDLAGLGERGATPGWLFYIGVDDVDAAATRITGAGGTVLMPPFELPGVGRMAFVADPGGAPFYIMTGASDGDSDVFAPGRPGHWSWNELWTDDAARAIDFYAAVFGWENRETMEMGPLGGYHFLDLGPTRLGALMRSPQPGDASRWIFYVDVPDLDAAITRVDAGGGRIDQGPHTVPGGSRIVVGTDPHGAVFALVSAHQQES